MRWWLVLAAGCPVSGPPEDPCPSWVALGDGQTPFRERADGEDAVIVHGPQGGYHVEVSVRASGTVAPWWVDLSVVDAESGVEVSSQEYHLGPDAVDACTAELPRLLAILDVHEIGEGTPAEELDGHEIEVRAVLTDDEGAVWETAVTVVARTGE